MKHEKIYRVYYEDVDIAGIVYYANYFKFIERARTEMLREKGITHTFSRKNHGFNFVVKKVAADFISPIKLDDNVKVQSEVTLLTKVRLVINQIILKSQTKCFEAKVTVACTDNNGHLIMIPKFVHDSLQE